MDECQDLNRCQIELSRQLAGKKGRLLYLGDPRQAIFGFAGAKCHSYQLVKARSNCVELPLSICYRCPKSHIALVKEIFPDMCELDNFDRLCEILDDKLNAIAAIYDNLTEDYSFKGLKDKVQSLFTPIANYFSG